MAKKKAVQDDQLQTQDKVEEIKALEETTEAAEEKKAEKEVKVPFGTHWYVIHTYSGHENKVAATLKQKIKATGMAEKIFDIMVPTQEKIEVREGKKVTLQEKIFPGYILVRMKLDDESWHTVRSTPGVTGFVGTGNKPTPLAESEVTTIKKFSEFEAPTYKASFTLGEAVRIVDGPFSEFLGTVDEINEEKGKVKVLVSIFGRETPVELDFLQVAKL
ncbi:MAG: transcription termination/antitermination protein NusG [bacterium]|nr:transcription termination/antitermination protein NusG [bacterium]